MSVNSRGVTRVVEQGEFFELEVAGDVADSPLYNKDIAPTKVAERTWNKWNVAALWVGMQSVFPHILWVEYLQLISV